MTARKFFLIALVVTVTVWAGMGVYYWYARRKGGASGVSEEASLQTRQGELRESPSRRFPPSGEDASGKTATGNEKASGEPVSQGSAKGWSVYKNEEFGYQIRYPEEFAPRNQGAVGTKVLNLTNFVATEGGENRPTIGIKIVTTPFSELEERMWKLAKSGYTVQKAPIAGIDGLRVSGKRSGTEEIVYEALFPSPDGEHTFRVITATEGESEEHLKIFDQMLESFSFL